MAKARIILEAQGSTSTCEKLLERVNLTGVTEVVVQKLGYTDGGPADVTYVLKDIDVIVRNGFGVGYGGTGPSALVKHLISIGFSKLTAERVYTWHDQAPLVLNR